MNKVKKQLIDLKWFIINFYNKIQHSKKLHFLAGVILTVLIINITNSLFIGLACGFLLGLVKEYLDMQYRIGRVDFNDFTAVVTGSALVILLNLLF